MKTKSPAFQFYAKDWLSSSQIALMPPQYEGAYIRLLAYCWDSGDCCIPDDDDHLAMLSRLGEGWFKGGSAVVRKCFVPHPSKPGFLTNMRLLQEANKQQVWSQKSAAGGRKSAQQRAEIKREFKGGSNMAEPIANSSSSSSSAKRERGTRFALAALPAEWGEFCRKQRPDLNPEGVFAVFADHWKAKPGKDGIKTDWLATWRNWVRREKDARPAKTAPFQPARRNVTVL